MNLFSDLEHVVAEKRRAGVADADLAELIYKDFVRRDRAGVGCDPHLYSQRFPFLSDQLERYFEVHAFVTNGEVDQWNPSSFAGPPGDGLPVPGETIVGDYRLVRELARRTMGVVYEARHLTSGRRVAVKMLNPVAAQNPERLRRFQNEIHAASLLRDKGMLDVLSAGQHHGLYYYVMPFIEGSDLEQVVDRDACKEPAALAAVRAASLEDPRSPDFYRAAARLGARLAEALEHAHQLGIIHRDVKPSNVLLDIDGRPWLTDFGLAHLEASDTLTATGDVLGTYHYMSPEQAAGESARVDRRSDVYSLGATIYHLLTGAPPFAEHRPPRLITAVLVDEPINPRRTNPLIPRSLETIVLTAMSKKPARRYDTARSMADDLTRFAQGQAIQARRRGFVDRCGSWAYQHRRVAGLLSAAVLTLVAAVILGLQYHVRQLSRFNRQLTDQQQEISEMLYVADVRTSFEELDQNNVTELQAIVKRHALEQLDVARGIEWKLLRKIDSQFTPQRVLSGHAGPVNELAIVPGKPRVVTVGDDATIRMWDVDCGKQVWQLDGGDGPLFAVAVSKDGRYLASGGKRVKLWDLEQRKLLHETPLHPECWHVEAIAFSPDGRWLAFGFRYDSIHLISLVDGREIVIENGSRQESISFTPDSSFLVCSRAIPKMGDDLRLVDLVEEPGKWARTMRPDGQPSLRQLVPSSNGSWIAAGGPYEVRVYFFDVSTGEKLASVFSGMTLSAMALSPDDRSCAGGYANGIVRGWIVKPGDASGWSVTRQHTFAAHDGKVNCLRYLSDGRLVTCGQDGLAKVWPISRRWYESAGPSDLRWRSVDLCPATHALAGLAWNENIIRTGRIGSRSWRTSPSLPGAARVRFSPDGTKIAVGGEKGEIYLLDAATLEVRSTGQQGCESIAAIDFSPDGRFLVTGSTEGTTVWKSPSLERVYDLDVGGCCDLARFSSDGRLLAVAGRDTEGILIFDADTRALTQHLPAPAPVWVLKWQPDQHVLVSGHHDGILVWNVESGAIKFALRRHDGRISDVAFSPDGRTLFSGSKDSTVRLWHTATGEYMGILYSAANDRNDDLAANPWMEYVNVTDDGKYIIASCDDEQANETTLIVWSCEQ